jgi:hypothetical protein
MDLQTMNQYIRALKRAARREYTHYIRQKARVERWYGRHPENLYVIRGTGGAEVARDPERTIDITRRYGACWWEVSSIGSVFDEQSYHLYYSAAGMDARELRREGKEAYAWLIVADDVVQEPAGRALARPTNSGRYLRDYELQAEALPRRIKARSESRSAVYS